MYIITVSIIIIIITTATVFLIFCWIGLSFTLFQIIKRYPRFLGACFRCPEKHHLRNENFLQSENKFIYFRIEQMYNTLVKCFQTERMHEMDVVLENLARALQLLDSQPNKSFNGFEAGSLCSDSRGHPKINVTEEQLEFLVEY